MTGKLRLPNSVVHVKLLLSYKLLKVSRTTIPK